MEPLRGTSINSLTDMHKYRRRYKKKLHYLWNDTPKYFQYFYFVVNRLRSKTVEMIFLLFFNDFSSWIICRVFAFNAKMQQFDLNQVQRLTLKSAYNKHASEYLIESKNASTNNNNDNKKKPKKMRRNNGYCLHNEWGSRETWKLHK